MNGITFQFTASSFPAQVTDTKSFNTLAMDGWTVQTRAWGKENYDDNIRVEEVRFFCEDARWQHWKTQLCYVKIQNEIELAEKLRKQKKSQQHKNEAENTHAQQS